MLISMYIISTAALFHNKINFKILNDACSFNDDSFNEKVVLMVIEFVLRVGVI